MISAATIIATFNDLFATGYGTRLTGGGEEPVYLPGTADGDHLIVFKEDFAASALHEVAHWCIAGPRRRQLEDYGYWYESRRDTGLQSRFQSVEVGPQGLEWIFSVAASRPFRVSFDNLDAPDEDGKAFRAAVRKAARERIADGLPARAARFANALATHPDGCRDFLSPHHYNDLPR
ncbi:MAG: elongation factor P hydroxylase [Pseudomonadales bacterium]|nr:elongation factor P hydroxylase [Pseudomonadales bacterium]